MCTLRTQPQHHRRYTFANASDGVRASPRLRFKHSGRVVSDAGVHFGLFISAAGFQAGAFDVVKHTNVHLLGWQEFQNVFLERWCSTYWVPTLRTRGDRLAGYVDPAAGGDAAVREAHGEPLEPAEAVGLFVNDMWGDPFNNIATAICGQPNPPIAQAIWCHRDKYRPYLPKAAADAKFLRELLYGLLSFVEGWQREQGGGCGM